MEGGSPIVSDPSAILNLVLVGGALLIGVAYLIHSWVTGTNKADDRLIDLQKRELDALNRRVASLEADNERLQREVSDLRSTNEALRGVVNPEAIAKALADISEASVVAVKEVATTNIGVYTGLLQTMEDEYLRPILDRLNRRLADDPEYAGVERRRR